MEPVADVLRIVKAVIGDGSRKLQRPRIDAGMGDIFAESQIDDFETEVKHFTRCAHVIATVSGTAAITLALVAAGVKPGDEVLVPSLTFAATANAIVHANAIPHFVDVNQNSLGIHPFKLSQYLCNGFETTANGTMNLATRRKVAAIVPVHLLGNPCEIFAINAISERRGIVVVEDAAEALGSFTEDGYHCGGIGDAGILSFNLNKMVTTGGGGAVLTEDAELAERARHLADQGKIGHPYHWKHDEVGWNYYMPPLNASVGIPQMRRLNETLVNKTRQAMKYRHAFTDITSARMIWNSGNHWINACLLDPRCMDKRDKVIEALLAEGFESRAMFTPLHLLPHFRHYPRQPSLEGSEDIWRRCVCLPSTP